MGFLDVRNQVGNWESNFTGFKRNDTVFVMHSKTKICKEAINKVFRDIKERSKVRMKYFKVKMTGACGYQLALKFVYLRNQEYLCILVYLRNQETT